MKFKELLKIENKSIQNSFLLGMVYAKPIILDRYILAYSSYRKGSKSEQEVHEEINLYYEKHRKKLQSFLGQDYDVELNVEIKEKHFKKNTDSRIQAGVSVILENDLIVPEGVNIINFIYGLIEKWLIDADEISKKYFIVGALDARGSLDFTARYIAMDIIEDDSLLVKRKLAKYNDIIGAVFNYNPRLVQEKSSSKNDQFRLPLYYYMGNFGLFTPFKIDYYKSVMHNTQEFNSAEDYFFIDLKYKDIEIPEKFISDRNLKINSLAIKLHKKDITQQEKRKIIEDWKIENFSVDSDDEILYSSQNMKEFSKKEKNYICEYDSKHITFNSKSNNKNYVEAHHLIPFSERGQFSVSIDITENIICLCPNCHRKIHLAIDSERRDFIESLFNSRKIALENAGLSIDLDKLFLLYKIKNNSSMN